MIDDHTSSAVFHYKGSCIQNGVDNVSNNNARSIKVQPACMLTFKYCRRSCKSTASSPKTMICKHSPTIWQDRHIN